MILAKNINFCAIFIYYIIKLQQNIIAQNLFYDFTRNTQAFPGRLFPAPRHTFMVFMSWKILDSGRRHFECVSHCRYNRHNAKGSGKAYCPAESRGHNQKDRA